MEEQVLQKIKEQDEKLDAIFTSVEKTRKYFLIIVWVTVALFVVPLIAAIFVLPAFLSAYLSSFEGLI